MAKYIAPIPPSVPLDLWRELYRAATRFQELAPWQWMNDSNVFGVSNAHGTRLVSVLGEMGEVFGVVSYRGSTGANFLLRLLNGQFEPEHPDAIFHQDALLADFVPIKELDKHDRAVMKAIDFKPATLKPRLYPEFKSHKPGYVPWFLEEAEARLLLDDLGNATRFAEFFRANPTIYDTRQCNVFPFLPTAGSEPLSADQLVWHTLVASPLPPDPVVQPEAYDLAGLMKLPQQAASVWELAAFYSSMRIGQPPRPYYPKLSLGVDSNTGAVLGFMLAGPEDTMAQAAAQGLVQSIRSSGFRPAIIKTDSLPLIQALQPIIAALEIKSLSVKTLPMAAEARQAMESFGSLQ